MSKRSHYKRGAVERPTPRCPSCGKLANETVTQDGIRCACVGCALWSWDRYPLVDGFTHAARRTAHDHLDRLWKDRSLKLKRGQAYARLARKLELPRGECHIKFMDKRTLDRVVVAVREIRQERRAELEQRARLRERV